MADENRGYLKAQKILDEAMQEMIGSGLSSPIVFDVNSYLSQIKINILPQLVKDSGIHNQLNQNGGGKMAYQKVEVGTWKPEKDNDSVEGRFIGTDLDVGENKSKLYHVDVDGKDTAIWGSAVLDTKMGIIKPGDKIKIVYLGKGTAQKGHNAPKLFDVFIDKN